MKRAQFAHTVRAAGAILNTDAVLVIGSQAVHAWLDDLFPEAERSIETDIAALEDEDGSQADLIDGSIGELSVFQETFGYYAQGVTPKTAVLPEGWRQRLVPFRSPATDGVTAHCLDAHDLWISKAIAGRPKDREFCAALVARGIVSHDELRKRLDAVRDLESAIHDRVKALIG